MKVPYKCFKTNYWKITFYCTPSMHKFFQSNMDNLRSSRNNFFSPLVKSDAFVSITDIWKTLVFYRKALTASLINPIGNSWRSTNSCLCSVCSKFIQHIFGEAKTILFSHNFHEYFYNVIRGKNARNLYIYIFFLRKRRFGNSKDKKLFIKSWITRGMVLLCSFMILLCFR